MKQASLFTALLALIATTGCGVKECALDDPSACGSGYVCETVQGHDKPLCVRPVQLTGKVFDLETGTGIAGAQVAAQDENGAPVGDVVVTDSAGAYVLPVPSARTDDKGAFVARKLTLAAAAADYERFPSGIRTAIPVDTAGATRTGEDDPFVLSGTAVEIGLAKLPADQQGLASVSGTVDFGGQVRSALVVAEDTSVVPAVTRSALAAVDGAFTIFNVPAGSYTVRAYTKGVNYDPVDVSVASTNVTDVALNPNSTQPAAVTGTIQIVSGSGATSVILVVKNTFNPDTGRGDSPAGLRAPDPGIAPNLSGGSSFSISGVPDGEYAVLAGFENDGMVRDPDTSLGGTDVQLVTVSGGVSTATSNFKITNAIGMGGPGADGLELLTSATPTFSWTKYSATDHYDVVVVDSLGQVQWTGSLAQPNTSTASLPYAGPALSPGGVYQWRAEAVNTNGITISRTEDLRGVFQVPR